MFVNSGSKCARGDVMVEIVDGSDRMRELNVSEVKPRQNVRRSSWPSLPIRLYAEVSARYVIPGCSVVDVLDFVYHDGQKSNDENVASDIQFYTSSGQCLVSHQF